MPEMSNFAVTCNLLSRYMKEKGSLAARPRLARAVGTPPITMNLLPESDVIPDGVIDRGATKSKSMELFPQIAGFGPAGADVRAREKAQLTIFYGGKVLVFDNFPAEKASDLMQMASKGSFKPLSSTATAAAAAGGAGVSYLKDPSPGNTTSAQKPPQPSDSYVPMARKQSLHRFLEKRKDRIQSKAPYQVSDSSDTVKKEESQAWLGLGPQISSKV